MMSMVSAFCGGLIMLSGFSGFMLNISVLYVLYKARLISSAGNSIYILAFCNIFGNTLQLFVSFFYLGPTTIAQQDYFEGGTNSTGTKFFSWISLGCWYSDMILQPVVALNRLVTVVFPLYSHIFDRKKTIVFGVMTLILGFTQATVSYFVIPCCKMYVYYGTYGYTYIDKDFNYVNNYIGTPFNCFSSFISISLYVFIFIYVRKNNLRASKLVKTELVSRKTKEIRYAVQFALCFIFVLFAWVAFRIFPLFIPPDRVAWFTFISIFLILHCVANSLIFIYFNKEFSENFFKRPQLISKISQNFPIGKESKPIPSPKVSPSNDLTQNYQY